MNGVYHVAPFHNDFGLTHVFAHFQHLPYLPSVFASDDLDCIALDNAPMATSLEHWLYGFPVPAH